MAVETETTAQTTETTVALPESTDVAGAVDLMSQMGLGDDTETPEARPNTTARAHEEGGDTVETRQETTDEGETETETEVEQEAEIPAAETTADGAPEFWSADDKAAWEKVPA